MAEEGGTETEEKNALFFQLLETGSLEEALSFMRSPENAKWISNASWDIIPVISTKIKTMEGSLALQTAPLYEEILCVIAQFASPDALLFDLLDKIDGDTTDTMLVSILKPMMMILRRLKLRRVQSLEFLLVSLLDNLQNVDVLDDNQLNYVFGSVISFCFGYICDFPVFCYSNEDQRKKEAKIFSNFALNMLALLAPRVPHEFADSTVKMLIILHSSLDVPLLNFMSNFPKGKIGQEKIEVPELAYQILCYMIHCQGVETKHFPYVYSPLSIFSCGSVLACGLIREEDGGLQEKGLTLLTTTLQHVSPNSISRDVLCLPVHRALFQALSKVMVFNASRESRLRATNLLRKYIEMFDPAGRHLYLFHAILNSTEEGVTGYLITIVKDFISEYMRQKAVNYYTSNIAVLVKVSCQLPTIRADLLFNASNQVISALNLIKFLCLKDPRPGLLDTGIWQLQKDLISQFLSPLWNMLEKSRDFLSIQLYESDKLETDGAQNEVKKKPVTLNVGGETLQEPTHNEEIVGIKANLNSLDFIQFTYEDLMIYYRQ